MADALPPDFLDAVRTAPFVIDGTVRKLKAATMPAYASDDTAVVRVNQMFRAPPSVGDLKGKDVTLQLALPKATEAGERATFYATSWIYGDSLALVEVAREPARVGRSAIADMHMQVANAEIELANLELERRVKQAELVVLGVVKAVGPLEDRQTGPISEHAPIWWWADIAVEQVDKGAPQAPTIRILFPTSLDEFWIDSPKFHAGQRGIWLLNRSQQERVMPDMRVEGLTALHPLDFQQPGEVDRIRALVKRSGR